MTIDQIINRLLPLLPDEGEKSKRAFALFCAERVAHLNPNPRVAECLAVVRQKVVKPESVTKAELQEAAYAADAAAYEAAYYAAAYAARAAYYAAYRRRPTAAYAATALATNAAAEANAAVFAAATDAADAAYDAAYAAREAERQAQLEYLLSLAMTQFYPGHWIKLEMFEKTGEIFTRGDFVSIRKITDENVLVALDYYLEKREALPLDYFKGLGCWCRR